jgi:hypothetical protein
MHKLATILPILATIRPRIPMVPLNGLSFEVIQIQKRFRRLEVNIPSATSAATLRRALPRPFIREE